MTAEEKVALVYAIAYGVPVMALAAFVSWRLPKRSNASFRAFLPAIGLAFAAMIGVGLVLATHFMPHAG